MAEHLTILTAEEIDQLYDLPIVNEEQRLIYFDLSQTEHQAIRSLIVKGISFRVPEINR